MTPTMTLAHLVFAIVTTAYIVLAIQFEERDLVAEHGDAYRTYKQRVPMLVPGARTRTTTASGASRAGVAVLVLAATMTVPQIAMAADRIARPRVPSDLVVSAAYRPFLVGHAIGTQNYICAPAATASGVDWLFIGPQATLFDAEGDQIVTHFQSRNLAVQDIVIDATWQHSRDTGPAWTPLIPSRSHSIAPGAT